MLVEGRHSFKVNSVFFLFRVNKATTSPSSSSEPAEACLTMSMVAELRGKRSDLAVGTRGSSSEAPQFIRSFCACLCWSVFTRWVMYICICAVMFTDMGDGVLWRTPLHNNQTEEQMKGAGAGRPRRVYCSSLDEGLRRSAPETGAVYAVSACAL